MLATSFKQKTDRILKKNDCKKSSETKGRIKGLPSVTHGYTFRKLWDDYYLFFTCGNMTRRGMLVEEMDKETMKLYNILKTSPIGDAIELETHRNQVAIKLLHEKE